MRTNPFDPEGAEEIGSDEGWYDVMQVCLNGHKITDAFKAFPEDSAEHCADCGAATITSCPKCKTDIRGCYHGSGVIGLHGPKVPAFCSKCGEPYPWTSARLEAARELAEELEGLKDEDRQALKANLDDLVRDTPRTTLAATRFKRIVGKLGMGAAEAFKDILVGAISETAKKLIWP